MKILHTSDLHVGKKLMGRERYAEYRAVFSELAEICKSEQIELVLIAGDVFDTYTPSAEAEEIFYSGVKLLAAHGAVLVISGNHDDYVRLTAAASLAEELNVYIVGNSSKCIKCAKREGAYPKKSGFGWVIFANGRGERVYINTLPYPNEARFKEGKTDESFEEKMARWLALGEEGKTEKLPSVLLSHIFVAGGAVSDSEREIDLGGTRVVPLDMLPKCDYIALGHLHKRQHLGKNAYYCGAPMQFTFDESGAKKSVNVFDLTENGVQNFKQIEVTSPRKLIRLQANGVQNGLKLLEDNKDYYVELTLNLGGSMLPAESAELHLCENLVSLKAEVGGIITANSVVSNKNKTSSQIFSDYYKLRYDKEVPKDLLSLFLSLTEEE
ncbi:MAG: exonuclease subunit SbcD [Clostridia bacterium]|nr:exonuclease subunit SbcD [Clostridia bacterium]